MLQNQFNKNRVILFFSYVIAFQMSVHLSAVVFPLTVAIAVVAYYHQM